MNPKLAHDLIREACNRREDLRWKDQKTWERCKVFEIKFEPYQGYCYIASQAFTFLVPNSEIWSTDSGAHYWNILDGEIWDLTKEQFNYDFLYDIDAKKRRKRYTKLVEELIKDIERNK